MPRWLCRRRKTATLTLAPFTALSRPTRAIEVAR